MAGIPAIGDHKITGNPAAMARFNSPFVAKLVLEKTVITVRSLVTNAPWYSNRLRPERRVVGGLLAAREERMVRRAASR